MKAAAAFEKDGTGHPMESQEYLDLPCTREAIDAFHAAHNLPFKHHMPDEWYADKNNRFHEKDTGFLTLLGDTLVWTTQTREGNDAVTHLHIDGQKVEHARVPNFYVETYEEITTNEV